MFTRINVFARVCSLSYHIHVNTTVKKIHYQIFFDIVSLALFVAMCERKLFAIVSVTIGLCQRKNARANTP